MLHTFHRFCTMLLRMALVLSMALPAAYADLPTLGDPTLGSLSNREESRLGLAYYRTLKAGLHFIDDIELNDYLSSLGQKLVTQSDEAGRKFTFFIVDSSVINAFALPAGYIGVHSGLFLDADNESQLASVLAHEISHVTQRHIARQFDSSGGSTAASIATILAAILVGSRDSQAGQAVLMGGLAGTAQAGINFTRQNEYEADRIGINLLEKAGINPEGMVEFFEHLLSRSSGGLQIEYLSTHPLDINRVTEAKNRIKEEDRKLPKDSTDFHFAKARLAVLSSDNNGLHKLIDANDKIHSTISDYLTAIALIRIDRPEQAIKILDRLAQDNKHPWIKLAQAEAYSAAEKPAEALNILEKLNQLYPGYLPVTVAYARALNSSNDPQHSIKLLLHQLQQDNLPVLRELLAQSYYMNGQISAALEATGDQYALEGYYELALQQYENALKQPGLSDTRKQRLETQKTNLLELQRQKESS
jgi:predicted Zn-dependent protease